MIETRGLIAAIEAADIMVKSSNVNLISRHKIGAGLVTITVEGDVGAVRAAVDAAEEGVNNLGCELISSHVIPSPSMELEVFFDDDRIKETVKAIESEYEEEIAERIDENETIENIDLEIIEDEEESSSEIVEKEELEKEEKFEELVQEEMKLDEEFQDISEKEEVVEVEEIEEIELFSTIDRKGFEELIEKFGMEKSLESIKHMTLTNIRKLAKEYEELSLSNAELAKASKKKVIDAIEECIK